MFSVPFGGKDFNLKLLLLKLNYKGLLCDNDINISSERHSIFADSDMILGIDIW